MEEDNLFQGSIWDTLYEKKIITKTIKLIELFSGIGAQAKALKILNIPFEHHKTCEWAYNSIIGYNAIHIKDNTDYAKDMSREDLLSYLNGNISINYNEPADLNKKPNDWLKNCYNNVIATHNLMSIMNVKGKDLDFTYEDTKKYDFVMTYSFPCQDLSLAGKRAGMELSQKDGGTRSGLLWEVERILTERFNQKLPLPNILIMENVPEVIGSGNEEHFYKWCNRLEELGYKNYHKILNSKNFGIPQNRRRCFMISILGEYTYDFPLKIELKYRLKDLLDSNVEEKYYLSQEHIERIATWKAQQQPLKDIEKEKIVSPTLTARGAGEDHSGMVLISEKVEDSIVVKKYKKWIDEKGEIPEMFNPYNESEITDVAPTQTTLCGNTDCSATVLIKESIPLKRGYSVSVKEASKEPIDGIDSLGSYSKCGYNQTSIVGENGIAPAVTENHREVTDIATQNEEYIGTYDYAQSDTLRPTQEDRTHIGNNVTGSLLASGNQNGIIVKYGRAALNETLEKEQVQDGLSQTLKTSLEVGIVVKNKDLRIRKITPKECMRLMGFEDKDYQAMVDVGLSDSAIYHIAGDSIVTTVIVGLIGTMTNKDYRQIINEYTKGLASNE